tara:strand:- start:2071 stop:3063 length:993 start_codon:yes stop_codon:yes gene_type:complete
MAATLKSVTLQIYIYTGTSGSYSASDLKFTLQKELITGHSKIIFEIAEMVRDYISVSFNNDYVSNTVWVTTIANLFDETGTIFSFGNPVTNTYLAFDAYGYFEDEINPQGNVYDLITSSNIILPKDTAGKLPVYAASTGSVVIDSSSTSITDNGNTNQKIQYVTIPANSSTILVKDSGGTTKKTITVSTECPDKFTPYKVTFVNKHGAFQDLYFFKKSVESFNVTGDESFKRNTVSTSTVTYNTYEGQKERFNVNAQSSIQLNTGYIPEDLKEAVEELFISENVFIRYESKTLPIIPKTKSFTHKTSLNDKLINYTVDFDFAFNKINNVR